jgi:diguanylate cyclase (GGDEF)-like protein
VSASFGVATLHANESLEQLFKMADDALYAAKHAGRNRVEVA